MTKRLLACSLLVCAFAQLQASVVLDTFEVAETEDFDSLSTTSGAWVNDSTLPNWFSSESSITASSGGHTAAGLYNYQVGGADRALGTIGPAVIGVQVNNNIGFSTVTLEVSYTGITWGAGAAINRLQFEYFIGTPDSIDSEQAGWIAVSQLNYVSQVVSTEDISARFAASVAQGGDIWLRWTDTASPGQDVAFAINDFSVAAVPEPSSYGMAAALFLIVVALGRRVWSRAWALLLAR